MRYHTAPLIGFTAYLEKLRYQSGVSSKMFEPGKRFQCYVNGMKIDKSNKIETKTEYRSYSLYFSYNIDNFRFRLDPGGTFFRHQPEGNMKIKDGWRYSLDRDSDYQEYNVSFTLSFPGGGLYGSYNNWHSERGEFSGQLLGDRIKLGVRGKHYRRRHDRRYQELTDTERATVWNFEIPFSQIKLPTT